MNLNLRAAFMVSQAVAQTMIARGNGGSIIHMSSQMGHVGAPKRTVYSASKHAIEGLTKAMAWDLAAHEIRVNAVAPTFIETPMTRSFLDDKAFVEDTLSSRGAGKVFSHPGSTGEAPGAKLYLTVAEPMRRIGSSRSDDFRRQRRFAGKPNRETAAPPANRMRRLSGKAI